MVNVEINVGIVISAMMLYVLYIPALIFHSRFI